MSPPATDGPPAPTTTREEAWVAHAALLDAATAATGDEAAAYGRPIESIEGGAPLDDEAVEVLRDALVDYLGDAPVRDRAPGRALLRRTDDAADARSRRA